MSLMVITVPPEFLPEANGWYTVILGDCLLPGHQLGSYPDAESADEACRAFAKHYGLKAYPLDNPGSRRGSFRVILGGKNGLSS